MPYRLQVILKNEEKKLGFLSYQRRWLRYLMHAAWWLYVDPGKDPTSGALFYFTGPKPYWYEHLDENSIKKIGSHTFGHMQKNK
jgi:hypothetical protein